MSGYTIKGFDKLLEKILGKIDEIVYHLKTIDESSEKYYIFLENYYQLMIDYSNIGDRKMDLHNKIQNNTK